MTITTKLAKNGSVQCYVNGAKMAISKVAELILSEIDERDNSNFTVVAPDGIEFTNNAWEMEFIYGKRAAKKIAEYIKVVAEDAKSNEPLQYATNEADPADNELPEAIVTVSPEAFDEALYYEQENANYYKARTAANANLPTGTVEVATGAEAFALIAPYFPNGLTFSGTQKEFNREDSFTFTDGTGLFAKATCTPDNSRVEVVEVVNTGEGKRTPLSVVIKPELVNELPTIDETDGSEDDADEEIFKAIIPADDNDYEETDEPEILNADLFVNLYHSPLAEEFSSTTRTINGEQLHFFRHRLTHISAPALNLEVYFDKGQLTFWHGFSRIPRDKVWQVPIIKETAKAQAESFGKFFAGDHTPKFFKVEVNPTFADGSEHNYVKFFDYFNQAQAFVEEVKNFIGDVLTFIYITHKHNLFYARLANGSENYTLPTVDAAQAQNRIDELNKAIADNESFADKCEEEAASKLRIANLRNERAIAYYEVALRMTEPTPEKPVDTQTKPDDFMTKLAELKANADAAKAEEQKAADALEEAQKLYDKAHNAVLENNYAVSRLYRAKANELKKELCTLPHVKIELKTTSGEKIIASHDWGISTLDNRFILLDMSNGARLGIYDTPKQVTNVINQLKAAINRGDKEFTFAPVETERYQVREMIA